MSPQQQAVILPSVKAPFVVGPRDIPLPEEGGVLIRIMSTALNPANWKQREYDVFIPRYPVVLGCDIAGVVEAIGSGVEGFKKGDKVFASTIVGGFQQYITLSAAMLISMPENASFDEAATFPCAFNTACVGLFAPSPIGIGLNPTFSWDKPRQGDSALVIGASTSVGQFAIQLLKFCGFIRIVAYASKAHFDYLRELGATECIDRTEVPLDSVATQISAPVNVVYDAFTGALNAAYDCLVDGGSIVTVLPEAMAKILRPRSDTQRPPTAVCCGAGAHNVRELIIKNLPEMMAKGAVTPNRCEVLPHGLAGISGGLERMQKGGVSGVKLVAHPHDPMA
ncbi:chaperonin 10-like protein [Mycena rosella]|uniref:Chaperonin 10-like protein n=1 Tax=Mycena rosella TaxID=1033263 RepID=A0AAD7DL50_MYCRO|nr:chaperonin 10-like protein [Mycena rosella]